ncbi:TetR/AcrR family transcriptional regulator [Nocardia bovistercoris]|uniref:TetR/AcrR family transcriptional regulator n=1 Tax=Nocardia bovistercoris TaxID=2785916 RepID=A0A931I937_9NOCA|nr:TetR/AcrR family transcriptional regulator [Nocardia bovistercoris]MBH0777222.1 TetR/AcrR family transcriptional regulator [Nocardia bovistercoris]
MSETTSATDSPVTDQRLVKGARARAAIARHAADVASVEGLNGVSIGRLATDLGLSKSGIATLFGSKEALQLAAVRAGREVFVERVISPALAAPRGESRLRVLIDRWFAHIVEPTFPGGCFRTAAVTEFDSRPGPVRDALAADLEEWQAFLAVEIGKAQALGLAAPGDPAILAFEVDAVVSAANTASQLGASAKVGTARAIVERILFGTPA